MYDFFSRFEIFSFYTCKIWKQILQIFASKSSFIVYLKDRSKYIEILGTMTYQGKSSHKYWLNFSLCLSLSFSLSHQCQGTSGWTWRSSRGICSQLFWSNVHCLGDDQATACTSSKTGNALFFLWSLKGNSWVERWEDSP